MLEERAFRRNNGTAKSCYDHTNVIIFFILLQHRTLPTKARLKLLTIPLTIRYLHYLLYNTSLEYNSYTTFTVCLFVCLFFQLHPYVLSELQCRTGFHLASSILLLLVAVPLDLLPTGKWDFTHGKPVFCVWPLFPQWNCPWEITMDTSKGTKELRFH